MMQDREKEIFDAMDIQANVNNQASKVIREENEEEEDEVLRRIQKDL
jgi:hypothetical protein